VTRSHTIGVVEPNTRCKLTHRPGAAGTAGGVLYGELTRWKALRIARHIDANLAGKIRIEDLATLLNLSTSHFYRFFKRTFGTSARTWIGRRRIEVAQILMLSTRAPLSQIALSCGMSDQSHFTRAFRRIVGETPHIWRQTLRAGETCPSRSCSPERGSPSLRSLCAHSECD
jgi:AraC family transcriptional regulator